ncbi:MAG TPA: hypothetical protein VFL94_09615 [Actinomycetales bacterium]|nr:hypothetical protein [Actinomycetales bacterium]
MTHRRRPLGVVAVVSAMAVCAATLLASCTPATQVEGVKFTSSPTLRTQTPSTDTPSTDTLSPTADGGLAVRLNPSAITVDAGQPVTLEMQYADAHGGLIGTVENFGDGGIGGLGLSDCHESEANPSTGSRTLHHVWQAPGTYTVSVTVTTLSCTHGQEEVTASAQVTVR